MSDPTNFTQNSPHQGAWLVYINGIEIPCPMVSVSYGVWMTPEATLSFPPHRLLQRLGAEDRLEVVVFFLDDLADPAKPEFKLLFEGEVIGWSYTSSEASQHMTFNAVADISIFTQLYFFFMNTADTVVAGTARKDATVSEPGVYYPFGLFKKGLLAASKEDKTADITRPYDILQNLMLGLVGTDVPSRRKAIPGVNFFARWARKRNFINRFAALPSFEDGADSAKGVFPIIQAVQSSSAIEAMSQDLTASVGDAGSIWDVLRTILGVVYCEIAMLPTAPCFRVDVETGKIIGDAKTPPTSPDRKYKEPLRLVNYFIKPQMLFGMAPTCNVMFPSMHSAVSYQENYLAQPTRSYVNDSLIAGMLQQNHLTAATLKVAYPPEVDAAMRRSLSGSAPGAGNAVQDHMNNGKNVLVWPEEFFKGPVVSRTPVPTWFTLLQNQRQAAARKDDPEAKNEAVRLEKLYGLYAQYEHFRSRYEKRGGSINLAWNPYLVPGFPCAVFDRRENAFDQVGYLMQVTHTLSASGGGAMSTSANYGYGRTIQEMFDTMQGDMARLGIVTGAGPADPVDSIREISQDPQSAEEFYRALFHGRQETPGRPAAFDVTKSMGYAVPGHHHGEVEPIEITGNTWREKSVKYAAEVSNNSLEDNAANATNTSTFGGFGGVTVGGKSVGEFSKSLKPKHNLDSSRELQPLPELASVFESYDAAMRYIARPICTLEEYISFLHGGKSLEALEASGQIESPVDYHGYTTEGVELTSAVFYERIRRLRQGPGPEPTPAMTGAVVTPPSDGETTGTAVPYTSAPTGVPSDFAQTRADWDSVLIAYRNEILARTPRE